MWCLQGKGADIRKGFVTWKQLWALLLVTQALAESTGPSSGECHASRLLISHCRPQHHSPPLLDTHKSVGAASLASLLSCAAARISPLPYCKLGLLYIYIHIATHAIPILWMLLNGRGENTSLLYLGKVTLCPLSTRLRKRICSR